MTLNREISIKTAALISLMTAALAVSAQITVPLPSGVPVTLQTFAVALCGYYLGAGKAMTTALVYILLGAVGVPVFSNFNAGAGALLGKTGGFIIGFLFVALLCGISSRFSSKLIKVLLGIAGLMMCHIAGTLWFSFVAEISFLQSATLVSLPFLIKDIACIVGAMLVSIKIPKRIQ